MKQLLVFLLWVTFFPSAVFAEEPITGKLDVWPGVSIPSGKLQQYLGFQTNRLAVGFWIAPKSSTRYFKVDERDKIFSNVNVPTALQNKIERSPVVKNEVKTGRKIYVEYHFKPGVVEAEIPSIIKELTRHLDKSLLTWNAKLTDLAHLGMSDAISKDYSNLAGFEFAQNIFDQEIRIQAEIDRWAASRPRQPGVTPQNYLDLLYIDYLGHPGFIESSGFNLAKAVGIRAAQRATPGLAVTCEVLLAAMKESAHVTRNEGINGDDFSDSSGGAAAMLNSFGGRSYRNRPDSNPWRGIAH